MAATTSPLAGSKVFEPLKLGAIELKNRVVMAPLTRGRSPEHIPDENVVTYYQQRASPGALLISEAVHISVMGGNYTNVPGIFTPEQKRGWKKVTDAVHGKGGFIYAQLWHVGRTTHSSLLGGRKPFGPSANKEAGGIVLFTSTGMQPSEISQPMTIEDIKDTVDDYVHAAKLAREAGFDGVQIHSANGYLLDQFLSDDINHRTDIYGGSTENRARLCLEVTDAVVAAIGKDRVAIRISPYSFFQGQMTSDIIGQYGYVVEQLDKRGLAFIEMVEPRSDIVRTDDAKSKKLEGVMKAQGIDPEDIASLRPFRRLVKETPFLVGGGYKPETLLKAFDPNGSAGDAVVFGRFWISNPDLIDRLSKGRELAPYNRKTFYTQDHVGYTDYPTFEEQQSKL